MKKRNLSKILLALLIIVCGSSQLSYAQFYFGKNKVQYTQFDWQVMQTEHFKIYFYVDEAEIASIAARSAEDSYRHLAIKFKHEVPEKIPLIIYSSPSYFSQTNVIPGLLPESVAGFTEFMKGRVVVPFHGSYHDFDHVIRHELVHVFTISKLKYETSRRSRLRYSYPPLWFTEGLAEFWSKDWDTQADMITKDMILNNMFFPISEMYRIRGTFFMYKLGESICQFIDSTYGSDKLVQIFENWHKGRSFNEVVKYTIGEDLNEISDKWEYSLKKRYFPEFDTLGLPDMESQKISKDGYNVKAVPIRYDDGSGEGDWIVFKANRLGYTGIYMKPLHGSNNQIKTLVKGERSAEFESLYLLRSGIDVYDNNLVVFSSKSKENDVMYIYDINSGSITERYEMKELISIRSPRFSHTGDKVAFSGVKKDGTTDLYLLNLEDRTYRAISEDIYYDVDPVFSLDDTEVIFASDRADNGPAGYMNLYKVNLITHKITQLTSGNFQDATPEVTEHGIYFSSDRTGSYNIFLLDTDNQLSEQSTFATGAFDPRLSPDGKKIIYAGYQKLGFHIYAMDLPEEPAAIEQLVASTFGQWKPKEIPSNYRKASITYDSDYSFDIAQSSIGYDPVYGSIGGFQAAISDVLGNRSVYLLLTNTATTKDDFLESFNFGFTYVQKEDRLNWGVGAYHLYDEYFNDYDGYYFEREAGGLSLFSYPISKFHRVDFTTLARYSKREKHFGIDAREKFLMTNYLSWVYDNSLWDISGPIEGKRYNISVGLTSSISDMSSWNRLASADIRHYFRIGKYSAFANRLFYFTSNGTEPQRIYLGGSWSFRGFDNKEFYNRNILFASNELRFPLIDNLFIGFPFGGGLGFQGIRGALFFDVGSAWDNEFDQFLGSFGTGFRVSLGYFLLLRFDFSRTTDFESISPRTDFDFFFGWNF